MAETTVLRDADGNYYVFAAEELAAARTADGTYDMNAEAVEAARVPDDRRDEIDSSLGLDEVAGFGSQPIPGIDIIVKKYPPGGPTKMTNLGSFGVSSAPGNVSPGGSASVR